jgi:UTP--glucose-1-phosphate uridylyltransferase
MKALIPAAGRGTRWYPWSRIIPKELLPLGRYPAIHYVLEEAVEAGIRDIGIILSQTKTLINTYVETIWKSDHPEIGLKFFYQPAPRGVADALLCARTWIQDEPVAVLYPDEIHPPDGGMRQLRKAFDHVPGSWIGLTQTKENRRQAALRVKETGTATFSVTGFSQETAPNQIRYGTGRYILGTGLMYLKEYMLQQQTGESEELDDDKVFEPVWEQGVHGMVLSEPVYDVGTPGNWLHTVQEYFNKPKDISSWDAQ